MHTIPYNNYMYKHGVHTGEAGSELFQKETSHSLYLNSPLQLVSINA